MPQPQNSPRGSFGKKKIVIGSQSITYDSTGIVLEAGVKISDTLYLTSDSTAIVSSGGFKVSDARYLTANSTAFIGTAEAAIPTTDNGAAFTLVSNSTGVALAVNTTGTTWKYLNVTSTQPT